METRMIRKRRRGTAIVESEKGILVVSGRKKIFLLPGGGASKWETRLSAAKRELNEETGLKAISATYLFRHIGKVHKSYLGGHFQDHHKVFFIKATGVPRPRHEIHHIAWYKNGSKIRLSGVTREIIEKYYATKQKP